MRERLRKFALILHPEMTGLIEFGRFAAECRKRQPAWHAGRLHLVGLYLYLRQDADGSIRDQNETRRDRMRAKLKMIKEEMWKRMHHPIPDQGRWLRRRVVEGYFNYYAVPTNAQALVAFRHHVTDL